MPTQNLLKPIRTLHLYFGVFITPALLFFAFTGAIQSFGLHETNRDHPNYKPAHWIVVLSQIHKKQTPIVAAKAQAKRAFEAPKPSEKAPASPAPTSPSPAPAAHNPLPLRIFFLIVCIGLFTSTCTGLYMTYNYVRNKRLVTLTLVAGIVIPLLLLLI